MDGVASRVQSAIQMRQVYTYTLHVHVCACIDQWLDHAGNQVNFNLVFNVHCTSRSQKKVSVLIQQNGTECPFCFYFFRRSIAARSNNECAWRLQRERSFKEWVAERSGQQT